MHLRTFRQQACTAPRTPLESPAKAPPDPAPLGRSRFSHSTSSSSSSSTFSSTSSSITSQRFPPPPAQWPLQPLTQVLRTGEAPNTAQESQPPRPGLPALFSCHWGRSWPQKLPPAPANHAGTTPADFSEPAVTPRHPLPPAAGPGRAPAQGQRQPSRTFPHRLYVLRLVVEPWLKTSLVLRWTSCATSMQTLPLRWQPLCLPRRLSRCVGSLSLWRAPWRTLTIFTGRP